MSSALAMCCKREYIAAMAKSATLTIRIDPDVKKRGRRAAEKSRRSLASLIEMLLDDYAGKFERFEQHEREHRKRVVT